MENVEIRSFVLTKRIVNTWKNSCSSVLKQTKRTTHNQYSFDSCETYNLHINLNICKIQALATSFKPRGKLFGVYKINRFRAMWKRWKAMRKWYACQTFLDLKKFVICGFKTNYVYRWKIYYSLCYCDPNGIGQCTNLPRFFCIYVNFKIAFNKNRDFFSFLLLINSTLSIILFAWNK